MKATVEFTLPEERAEHLRAVHAGAAWACLEDIDATLRSAVKYGHDYKSVEELAQHLRREIAEVTALVDE